MGGLLSSISSMFAGTRDVRITAIGLDAAGKTTLVNKLKTGESLETAPTIGFIVETIEHKNLKMQIFDVGGQERLRRVWSSYFANCDAVIWVVDSADKNRLEESFGELKQSLEHHDLANCSVLVFANKQDLPGAMSTSEITAALKLNEICRSRKFWVQGSVFTQGKGITEGLDWLSANLPPPKQ